MTRHMYSKLATLAAAAITATVSAQTMLVSGRPVPELDFIDTEVTDFMTANGIQAGVVGIMSNGRIVYLKGFSDFSSGPLPENTLMRIASVTKPVTGAAVRKLIADGNIALNDWVFDLGQAGGGLLDHDPWPNPIPGDSRLAAITVDDCLRHRGGWDSTVAGVGDFTRKEREIATDMGVQSPPGRDRTIRWILGKSLQFDPGTATAYSNVGFLVLGMIVEKYGHPELITYLRENILTPEMWVPATELQPGRTFLAWQDPREWTYESPFSESNVFDWFGPPTVSKPYGAWDHEARIGQGGLVISAPTILEFAQRYRVGVFDQNIGQPLSTSPLTGDLAHGGSLAGTDTRVIQREDDNVNVFISFNSRPSSGTGYARQLYDNILEQILDDTPIATTTTSDGFWVDTGGTGPGGVGGFGHEFNSFAEAVNKTVEGSKLRLKPGTTSWTGTLSERCRLDAPLGTARIGQ